MGRHKVLDDARYLTVRIDGWTDKKLRQTANEQDQKVSQVVRIALENYLDYAVERMEAK